MKRFQISCALGLCVALGLGAAGMPAASRPKSARADTAAARTVQIPIQQFTLKNGLRVVLSEDHAAPTVSLG